MKSSKWKCFSVEQYKDRTLPEFVLYILKIIFMKISRLNAARKFYDAKAAEATETIKVYLSNAAGIGEHPQIMEELRGQIEILANAKDCIQTIDSLISEFMADVDMNSPSMPTCG